MKLRFIPLLRYLPAVLFFLFILWLITLADSGSSSILFRLAKHIPQGDKVGHIGLYGVLTWLLNLAFAFRTVQIKNYTLQWGAFWVLSFALLEELSQYFFPHRSLDIIDALADVIGISLFSYLSVKWHHRERSAA